MPTTGPRITISQRWDLVGVGFVDIGKDLESLLLLGFGYSAEIVERKKEKKRGEGDRQELNLQKMHLYRLIVRDCFTQEISVIVRLLHDKQDQTLGIQ